ncbi:MAG: hypothetical protein KF729_12290 [Sandaracinaceae bacterium]|nr:hypothetical protein [Sandaracinaceae bacterium]
MRALSLSVLVLAAPAAASAQYHPATHRPATPVAELSEGTLYHLVSQRRHEVTSCAARTDTGAYVADVEARVAPGPRPSTLYNARIEVSVRSRHRDGELEACVRRAIVDALRHETYAVGRAVRTRQTFRIRERPEPPEPPPAVAFSEGEARSLLESASRRLAACLETAGVPEQVVLHITVERTGRMTLTNATLPPGAGPHALGCLSRTVSSLATRGRPERRVQLTHHVGTRTRAY